MINFNFNENCYGCGICEFVCSTDAIILQKNDEGFLMPIINSDKCVSCGKCKEVCIHLSEKSGINIRNSEIAAVYLNDENLRRQSTSGGVFYALASAILNQGGIVCGCVWNDELEAEIVSTDDLDVVNRMRGSKYVQASIKCYAEIDEALRHNRKVLFSGLPCQIAAVQKRFNKNDNLVCVSLLCEGVASPLAWQKYKSELEGRFNSKMVSAIQRKKGMYGWIAPMSEYQFENSKKFKTLSFTLDYYVHNMIYGFFTRNSCYNCEFKGENSTADIMIGDFWGLPKNLMKKSGNLGCSVALINTVKGHDLFNKVSDIIYCEIVSFDAISKKNPPLLYPAGKNSLRDKVMHELKDNEFSDVINKYCNMNTPKVKIQRLLHLLGLAGFAKRILRR